jgi:predicted DNA-binding transcriptional regulator AlpA
LNPIPSSTREVMLPARQVWTRYGVSDRTIDRWLARADLGFPKPVEINRRRYWKLADIEAWERSRASSKMEAA